MRTSVSRYRRSAWGGRWFLALCVGPVALCAADPVVSSFEGGTLTWSNAAGALQMYSIEWAQSPASNRWWKDWVEQSSLVTTQRSVATPVPMFYRVAAGFDNRALDGVWVIYHPDGPSLLKADGRGLVTEFGANDRAPSGMYLVQTNGQFEMTLFDAEERIILAGNRLDALSWQFVYATVTGRLFKVENPGALAGVWRGTIGPYTNVVLQIRDDGFIPVISNLIDVASGVAYADRSNTVVAAIYTGADKCSSPWNRIWIRGIRTSTTNILGDYELDWESGWITAGVHLRRP